jgi:hypothetical protein
MFQVDRCLYRFLTLPVLDQARCMAIDLCPRKKDETVFWIRGYIPVSEDEEADGRN